MSGVEGWIDWHGGENPVPGLVVQVQWRDQSARYTPDAERCSDEWSWGHHDMYCDIIAYRVVTPAALSAIEGGGGALQPSASVPTEQADGGVVAALETACRVLRGIPKPRTNDGVSIVYSVSDDVPEDIYTARSHVEHALALLARTTPPATPIAGGFGSNRQGDLPTEPVADRWADLERLAREWGAISPDNPSTTCKERGAFRDAANPAAILELIAAARQQPNREG